MIFWFGLYQVLYLQHLLAVLVKPLSWDVISARITKASNPPPQLGLVEAFFSLRLC